MYRKKEELKNKVSFIKQNYILHPTTVKNLSAEDSEAVGLRRGLCLS